MSKTCSGLNGNLPKDNVLPEPVNKILFGKMVFANVIMLRSDHPGLRVNPECNNTFLYKIQKRRQRHIKEKELQRQVEIGLMHLQAKEHQGLLAATTR